MRKILIFAYCLSILACKTSKNPGQTLGDANKGGGMANAGDVTTPVDPSNQTIPDEPDNIDPEPSKALENKTLPSTVVHFNTESISPLGQTILANLKGADPKRTPIDAKYLSFTKNKFLNSMVEGPEIYTEYKRLIAMAKKEILLETYVWFHSSAFEYSVQNQGFDGMDIPPNRITDPVISIGEGLIKAQKNLADGEKLSLKIQIDEVIWYRLMGRKVIEEVNDSVQMWYKMGLDPKKITIEFSTLKHLLYALTHDKFLIIDGKYLAITGSNIQYSNNYMADRWHDLGLSFEGPIALAAMNVFDKKWNEKATHWTCDATKCESFAGQKSGNRPWLQASANQEPGVYILPIPQGPKEEEKNNDAKSPQTIGWKTAIQGAKKSLYVQSPSINSEVFMEEIVKAAVRGVDVRVITSKAFNHRFFEKFYTEFLGVGEGNEDAIKTEISKYIEKWTTDANRLEVLNRIHVKWYSRDGKAAVWGNTKNSMHSKLMIIDEESLIMGSGNQDESTWRYFSEFNLFVDNAELAQSQANRIFLPNWAKAIDVSIF